MSLVPMGPFMRVWTTARRVPVLWLCLAALVSPANAEAAPSAERWIVRLADPPVASYRGGEPGLAPTSPAVTGRALRPRSTPARRYAAHLDDVQSAVTRRRAITPRREYRYTFAGFAATLTDGQVAALLRDPRVASVEPNELLEVEAAANPDPAVALGGPVSAQSAQHLGLPNGLWKALGGPESAAGAGAGKVVGVIDTGIDPELPSFAAQPAGAYIGEAFPPPPVSFKGACQAAAVPADGFACTNKIVGARWYLDASTEKHLEPKADNARSARDRVSGHGSHTAGIAAGNYGVDPDFGGTDGGVDVIAGIAPRAHIAVYKACWTVQAGTGGGCPTIEVLSAFDDAIKDGVDVINFSIGTGNRARPNASAHAILAAQEAGVPVAQSAGNNGPGADTVGATSNSWWALSVGATTGAGAMTSRSAVITLAAGTEATGISALLEDGSVLTTSGPRQLVEAQDFATGDAAAARRCEPGALAGVPTRAAVICDRRFGATKATADEVQRAGGGVAIIVNIDGQVPAGADVNQPSNLASFTPGANAGIPVISVGKGVGQTLLRANAGQSPDVSTPRWRKITPDVLAAFSSRGPSNALPGTFGPMISAPGVEILAAHPRAIAYAGLQGLNGTSMASPHVAGILALLEQRRADRTWTSDELRSALMTTAVPVSLSAAEGGGTASPAQAGAGRVDPQAAADPGLVVADTPAHYREVVRTVEPARADADLGALRDAADLNVPFLSLRDVVGTQTVRRLLRSVTGSTTTWTVETPSIPGWTVSAQPSTLTVPAGESATLDLTATAQQSLAEGSGEVRLVEQGGAGRVLRLPVLLRAVNGPLDAPVLQSAHAGEPSGSVRVRGQARSAAWKATTSASPFVPESVLVDDAFASVGDCSSGNAANKVVTYDVPPPAPGTPADDLLVRSTALGVGSSPTADLDLYLYAPGQTTPSLSSESIEGHEVLRVANPVPGRWKLEVAPCGTAARYELRAARLPTTTSPLSTVDVPAGTRLETQVPYTALAEGVDHVALLATDTGTSSYITFVAVSRKDVPVLGPVKASGAAADGRAELEATVTPNGVPTWARILYEGETPAGAPTEPIFLGSGSTARRVTLPLGTYTAPGGAIRVVLERRGQPVVTGPSVPVVLHAPPATPPPPAADNPQTTQDTPPIRQHPPVKPPVAVPTPDVLTDAEVRAAVKRLLAGRRKLRGKVVPAVRVLELKAVIKPTTALRRAKLRLLALDVTGKAGARVASKSLGTVRAKRKRTVALTVPRRGTYLLVLDARQKGKAARLVRTIVVN